MNEEEERMGKGRTEEGKRRRKINILKEYK